MSQIDYDSDDYGCDLKWSCIVDKLYKPLDYKFDFKYGIIRDSLNGFSGCNDVFLNEVVDFYENNRYDNDFDEYIETFQNYYFYHYNIKNKINKINKIIQLYHLKIPKDIIKFVISSFL